MWDWFDDAVNEASGFLGDAWDTVNDLVDTYIWDTTSEVAVVESWVRDTFNIPDQEGIGFVAEAIEAVTQAADDAVKEVVDYWDYWDDLYLETVAPVITEVVKVVKDVADDVAEVIIPFVNDAAAAVVEVTETVTEYVTTVANQAGDIINNISLALGVGFDVAMAAIAGLPALITGLKSDLAGWFDIDVEKLIKSIGETQQTMKPPEVT